MQKSPYVGALDVVADGFDEQPTLWFCGVAQALFVVVMYIKQE